MNHATTILLRVSGASLSLRLQPSAPRERSVSYIVFTLTFDVDILCGLCNERRLCRLQNTDSLLYNLAWYYEYTSLNTEGRGLWRWEVVGDVPMLLGSGRYVRTSN